MSLNLLLFTPKSESTPEAPETEGLSTEPVSQAEVSIVGETLEDMSLSSTSSLDRNDTSQEYMDDFDNLGKNAQKNTYINITFIGINQCSSHDSQWKPVIPRVCRKRRSWNNAPLLQK